MIWASGDLYEAIDKLPVAVDLYMNFQEYFALCFIHG